jgi:hypothetical protein
MKIACGGMDQPPLNPSEKGFRGPSSFQALPRFEIEAK